MLHKLDLVSFIFILSLTVSVVYATPNAIQWIVLINIAEYEYSV